MACCRSATTLGVHFTYFGKTKSEALENSKDAIKGYLESLKKHPEERILEKAVEIETVTV